MNPLLQVKLRFNNEKNNQKPGDRNLRKKSSTSSERISKLIDDLNHVLVYYDSISPLTKKLLIDINYNDIIAKSNRVVSLLKPEGSDPNHAIVGARFSEAEEGKENHIITYYVDRKTIERSIDNLKIAQAFLADRLGGEATSENFKEPNSGINYEGYGISKSMLRNLIIDCSVIDSFGIPGVGKVADKSSYLLTFYNTELSVEQILKSINIDKYTHRYESLGENTISVEKDIFEIINREIPYMISMVSSDLSTITLDDVDKKDKVELYIEDPQNEPVIGVIDTLFDESVYFSKWVEHKDYLDIYDRYNTTDRATSHGTEVSSLIVDGPQLNPWLDDNCGHFRVRHFSVCKDRIKTPRLMRKIREIIDSNPDIHVWNLSLGTEDEVSQNFISYDAAILDEIQAKKNVIFVIAGTNDNREVKKGTLRIGSPADSLNSIVVNSVKRNGNLASYTRKGNILSFFNKPDVSYYGGDYDERIKVFTSDGIVEVSGTSYAAPWISRKLCYMIDILGFSKEVAKALLIDSAAGWDYKKNNYKLKERLGYGIVPIDINDIVSSGSDEIKFIISGSSISYKTTNYAIPVPKDDEAKYPYISRATLCYFPKCSRLQGVDYTNRELSIKFGRIKSDGTIQDINHNTQDDPNSFNDERTSRREFRKWDNTKFISSLLNKNKPLKSYDDRLWGFSITSKGRLTSRIDEGLHFGVVITMKEVTGINRIDDFIKACTLRGWIVNKIDVQNKVEVYNKIQEEITFE